MNDTISIEVISDVVCPWCYVGKRRLERALALIPQITATVRWRPFRLDPTIPPEGISRDEYLSRKFGDDRAKAMFDQLSGLADGEGIVFNFERIARSPNTVDAHRVIKWSQDDGLGDDLVERLFVAYFSEGRDVGDADVLVAVAEEAGMSADTIRQRLTGDVDRAETVAEVENAYRIGVSGVPCYVLQERLVVMGARPPEIIVQAIGQALAEPANDDPPPTG
ncbi:MAG: DsbA family oxidoreductase [Alphaproteobacteria bacterium]